MALEPLPYLQFSTCVSASGWNDDVIATPRDRSCPGLTFSSITPLTASELVRVRRPSCADSRGSTPVWRIECRSFWVPQVPAANTTWSAVTVCRARRNHAPLASCVTAYPPPRRGATRTTVRIGSMVTPSCSARAR